MAHQETFTPEEIQHYLQNPDEVDATNINLVEALALASGESALLGDTKDEGGEGKATDGEGIALVEGAERAAVTAAPAKTAEVPAEGARVATPDGKHVIPYKVLQDERSGRQAAEAALSDTQRQLLSVTDRLKALEEGRDPGDGGIVSEDELAGLAGQVENEAPWLKETFTKLVDAIRVANDRIAAIEGDVAATEEEQVAQLTHAAQGARERNPTLVLWESQAPALFQEAIEEDAFVRSSSLASRFKTFDQRFAHVVERVKLNHAGENLPLPKPAATAAPVIDPKAQKPAQPSADIQARAAAALAKAKEQPIGTISDIPGGTPPTDSIGALERMDSMALLDTFSQKTPQQIIDFVMAGGR